MSDSDWSDADTEQYPEMYNGEWVDEPPTTPPTRPPSPTPPTPPNTPVTVDLTQDAPDTVDLTQAYDEPTLATDGFEFSSDAAVQYYSPVSARTRRGRHTVVLH